MMKQSFCADVSQQMGEDLIGSATPHQTFVLIECPFPWKADAFESRSIPQSLRSLVASVKAAGLPVRFLLINRQLSSLKREPHHLLIYQRSADVFCQGYQRYEWVVNYLDEVAPLVQAYLSGQIPSGQMIQRPLRDLLVCVHGSYDRCCARYGMPFCQQATATLTQLKASLKGEIRLWQTSHFGGHRFAPTLIDFPTGRYYGRMTQTALQSILTRSGSLKQLNQVYRGWSVLPTWLQIAERELMQRYGWNWFDSKIACRLVSRSGDSIQAKLSVMLPGGEIHSYAVEVAQNLAEVVCLKTSCGDAQPSEQVKYQLRSLTSLHTAESPNGIHPRNTHEIFR